MTTAYTSLLGLALPVTGELQGTWGDVVNNSITLLLDSAIAGTTTISTDGDVTLTTTTGASNQAREAIILCSGARTAQRTITAPAQSKIYTIINSTTGGFAVKLVGAGPTTGITVVAGESALVAWNGSDFIKISNTGGTASFTNVTVSGTTTLSGLTASTALALDASKNVVSVTNTGTGNNVLATSPTLSGVTLSDGTANGVLYLNGSKVATAGTALTFDGTTLSNIGAGDRAKFGTGTRNIYIAGDTGGVSLFDGAAQTGNGWYISGASNYVAGYIGSSEQMRLTSTGLGIGTSSPANKLHVNGDVLVTNANYYRSYTSALASVRMLGINAGNVAYIGPIDSGPTSAIFNASSTVTQTDWYNSGSSAMTLTSTGLGIGLTAVSRLDAGQSGGSRIRFDLSSASTASVNYSNYAGSAFLDATHNAVSHIWTNAGTELARLTSTGLGIGTSSPAVKLDVSGSSAVARVVGTAGSVPQLSLSSSGVVAWSLRSNNDGASDFTIYQDATQRLKIDSSGNLGIGTSSPLSRLDVREANRANSTNITNIGVYTTTAQAADVGGTIGLGGVFDAATGYAPFGSIRGGKENSTVNNYAGYLAFQTIPAGGSLTERMRLDSSGNLGLGVTPSAWSLGGGVALQTTSGALMSYGTTQFNVFQNAYYNGSSYIYKNTAAVSGYQQSAGGHIWYNAPSGTAGTVISLTQAMTLDANGNLGVGTTSPGYKLDVSASTNTIIQQWQGAGTQFTLRLKSGNGATASSSVYRLYMDYLNGTNINGYIDFYRGPAGNLGYLVFGTDGSDRMTLDASGNLGLGVTPSVWNTYTAMQLPGGSLSGIAGSQRLELLQNAYYASGAYNYVSTAAASFYRQSGGVHSWLNAASGTAGTAISFTQAMTLDASGNLGVGTTSPGAKLHVVGSQAIIQSTSSSYSIWKDGTPTKAGRMSFNSSVTDGLELGLYDGVSWSAGLVLDPSGNVGIGTTSPNYRLDVLGSATESGRLRTSGSINAFYLADSGTTVGSLYIGTVGNDFRIVTGSNERARITSGGNLLVGQTATGLQNSNSADLAPSAGNQFTLNKVTGSGSGNAYINFGYAGGAIGSITQSGTTAVVYNTTSDRRLKQNIVPAPSASDDIDAIQIVSHDWKAAPDEHVKYGVIAQDLHAVAPQAVSVGDDGDEIEKTWGVDYSKLVPMLIKEVQSLRARVAQLEAKG